MTAPARPDWHTHTPAEVLDGNIALTLQQVAYVLGLAYERGAHRGEPKLRAAYDLVLAGRLHPIDPGQPVGRLRVSATEVRRYLDGNTTPALTLVHGAAS